MLVVVFAMSYACIYARSAFNYQVQFIASKLIENPEDLDPESMRKPTRHINGSIDSENGIQIPGLDKSQVVSYELYSEDTCMGSWPDEEAFLMQLTQQDGLVEIRINLPEYFLSGYIELPL